MVMTCIQDRWSWRIPKDDTLPDHMRKRWLMIMNDEHVIDTWDQKTRTVVSFIHHTAKVQEEHLAAGTHFLTITLGGAVTRKKQVRWRRPEGMVGEWLRDYEVHWKFCKWAKSLACACGDMLSSRSPSIYWYALISWFTNTGILAKAKPTFPQENHITIHSLQDPPPPLREQPPRERKAYFPEAHSFVYWLRQSISTLCTAQ